MKENFMTFNLKYDFTNGNGYGWGERADRICEVIKDNNPLCIGIQEGLIHMLDDLGHKLNEYSWFGEGREGDSLGEFNSIFYKKDRLILKSSGQFWLSETPNVKGSKSFNSACERICTWGEFKEVETGKEFIVYNTHLDHESEEAREEGIKIILDFVHKNFELNEKEFIIMGDFNCHLDDEVFNIIKSYNGWDFFIKNTYNEVEHNIKGTFHDFKGGYDGGIIDYILTSNKIDCYNINIDDRMINGWYPSDHYPVIAKLEIN